jgi:uncharacterized protein
MSFDFDKVKGILVCPECHSDLIKDGDSLVCTNPEVRLRYAILEGIPRLLVDEAEKMTSQDWVSVMQEAGRDPETGTAN